jgi:hypothetical protein
MKMLDQTAQLLDLDGIIAQIELELMANKVYAVSSVFFVQVSLFYSVDMVVK